MNGCEKEALLTRRPDAPDTGGRELGVPVDVSRLAETHVPDLLFGIVAARRSNRLMEFRIASGGPRFT
jgi:hypothetical protein